MALTDFNLTPGRTRQIIRDLLDGITHGVAKASKALILDANKAVDAVRTAALYLGASGSETLVAATAAELNAACDVSARRVAVADASTYTLLAANSTKTHVMPDLSQNCTVAMPAEADGLEFTFISKGVAADASNWVFDTGSDTNYFIGGLGFVDVDTDVVATISGDGNSNSKLTIVTPAPGTRVNFICDGTLWILSGIVVSNTIPSFADQ